ncbi:MAG: PEP-CTERM sorting domain-containing protein [Phycisphaerales bacterium]|nr:PEP-CTERM sorting domain-containing protein [Phycisphaerales bacterium]
MKISIQSFVLAAAVAASMGAVAQAVPETYTWDFSSPQGALGTTQVYTSAVTPSGPSPVDVTAYGFQVTYDPSNPSASNTQTGSAIHLYGNQGSGTENGLGLKNYPYQEIGFLVTQNQGGQNNDGQNNDGQNNDGQNYNNQNNDGQNYNNQNNDGQNNDGQNNDGNNNDGQNNDGNNCDNGGGGTTTYEGFVQVDLSNLLKIPNVDPFATITIGSLQNGTYDAYASSTLGTIGTNEIIDHSTTTPNTFLLSDFSLANPYLTITANDQAGLDKSILLSTLSVSTGSPAPEPATIGMLAIGGVGLLLGRRRKSA